MFVALLERGEKEAEDWHPDYGDVVSWLVKVIKQVDRNSFIDLIPPNNTCHAQVIDNIANYGHNNVHTGGLGREGDIYTAPLFRLVLSSFAFLPFPYPFFLLPSLSFSDSLCTIVFWK